MELDDLIGKFGQTLRNASWWIELIRKCVKLCKDSLWPIFLTAAAGVAGYLAKWLPGPELAQLTVVAFLLAGSLIYMAVRVRSYRGAYKRICASHVNMHNLIHQLRDSMCRRIDTIEQNAEATGSPAEIESEEVAAIRRTKALEQNLENVLGHAAYTMRSITRSSCTASLVLPYNTSELGDHFRTVLYCRDTDPERIKSKKPKYGSFVEIAFSSPDVMIVEDYRKEIKKGNKKSIDYRDGTFRWYTSAIMAHFKVHGKPYGVLCVDAPDPGVFYNDHKQIIAALSDALAVVFILNEYDILDKNEYP